MLPASLLLPAGLAVMVVAMSFPALRPETAELAVPLAVALAVAGLCLASPRALLARLDRGAAAAGAATYIAFGVPVLATGETTFAGYVKLDDTATYLGILDRVLEHGPTSSGLPPSTYEAALSFTIDRGYPVGSLLPLGLASRLVGLDAAWTWQPYLSLLAALLALCLFELTRRVISSAWLRALVATTASCSALLYGYALWGGVKEVFAAGSLALLAATAPLAWRGAVRHSLVPAIAAASLLLGLSAAAAPWLAPAAVTVAVAAARSRSWTRLFAAGAFVVALSLPALVAAWRWLPAAVGDGWSLGQLTRPLSPLQLLGIWPVPDVRLRPEQMHLTVALLTACVAGVAIGGVSCVRRSSWPLLLLVATAALGAAAALVLASPWIEAKALAIASPAVVLVALAGGATLLEHDRPAIGVLLLGAVAGGVLWSDVVAGRNASLAPRDRLAELESIGERFAGDGPALENDYQPYGVRHFLRRLDPEGASELRRRLVPLRDGSLLGKGEEADIQSFAPDTLLVYRTLVVARTSTGRAPGPPFALVHRGRFYDVWQQPLQG